MPEGEEDDRLDHEELEDGAVGAEQLAGGEVEEEEGVEGQADGDVVDDGHVQVAATHAAGRRTDMLARPLQKAAPCPGVAPGTALAPHTVPPLAGKVPETWFPGCWGAMQLPECLYTRDVPQCSVGLRKKPERLGGLGWGHSQSVGQHGRRNPPPCGEQGCGHVVASHRLQPGGHGRQNLSRHGSRQAPVGS